jgi:recombination protein RecA
MGVAGVPGVPGVAEVGAPVTSDERAISSGFRALDAILGLGGLPRASAVALQGDGTSGKTTLALRAVAQVQATGGIVAYLDLARSLDPVEAAARGVQLEWLVVLTPDSLEEALSMAAMLLQDRTVDLLLLDLPSLASDRAALSAASLGERLHRLAALARRASVQMLVLEPPDLPSPITGALAQIAALRLELSRRAWIRLGRDVVGQRTEVRVSRDRFGPPGRATELRILYAEGGPRDACLARDELLRETAPSVPRSAEALRAGRRPLVGAAPLAGALGAGKRPLVGAAPPGGSRPVAGSSAARPPLSLPHLALPVSADATPSPLLAPPPPSPGPRPILHPIRGGADRVGRQAVDGWAGPRRKQVGARTGGQTGHAARGGPQAGAGGAIPRSRPGG